MISRLQAWLLALITVVGGCGGGGGFELVDASVDAYAARDGRAESDAQSDAALVDVPESETAIDARSDPSDGGQDRVAFDVTAEIRPDARADVILDTTPDDAAHDVDASAPDVSDVGAPADASGDPATDRPGDMGPDTPDGCWPTISCDLMSLSITPDAPTLGEGVTQWLTAWGTFADGSMRNLTASVTWSSTLSAVAIASNAAGTKGLVTAMRPGTAVIATAMGAIQASTVVTVQAATPASFEISPVPIAVVTGTHQRLVGTLTFVDGTLLDVTGEATWSISNSLVASIGDATGNKKLLTGVAPGKTVLTATVRGLTAAVEVTVSSATLVGLQLGPRIEMPLGIEQQLQLDAFFSDGSMQDVTADASWTSSSSVDATVGDSPATKGRFKMLTGNSVTVRASYGGLSQEVAFDVLKVPFSDIEVFPFAASVVLRMQQVFEANAQSSDGRIVYAVARDASWASSDDAIVKMNGNIARAEGVGTATITVSYGGVSRTTTMTVRSAKLEAIDFSVINPTVPIGEMGFYAFGTYSDGSVLDLTDHVAWSSSDLAVAMIRNVWDGRAIAIFLQPGTVTITARFAGAAGSTLVRVVPVVKPTRKGRRG
jgi:trimeric autotransporter adhesin